MEEASRSKETAFVFVFRDKQEALGETFLNQDPVLNGMVKNYSRYWKTMDQASNYFEFMHKCGKLTKRVGKYNLE